ncbi:MAG: acetyltransferase [Edaphobacter sp.]|nr:acetyltransferase [Edaphobacter sp.]
MPYFIRAAGSVDVPAIAAIYAPFVLNSTATLELEPPDVAEVERRLRSVQQGGLPYLVAEADGVIVGYAYAAPFRPRPGYRFTVEDSVYLRADYAGRGIGKQLLATVMERCKDAGCRQMVAVIGGANPASVTMHAGQGFAHVGVLREVGFKFGQWQDVTLMQRGL